MTQLPIASLVNLTTEELMRYAFVENCEEQL